MSNPSDVPWAQVSQHAVLGLRHKAAANALGISERKLFELTKNGQIPCVRIGRAVVYPVALLNQWLLDQASKGGTVQ